MLDTILKALNYKLTQKLSLLIYIPLISLVASLVTILCSSPLSRTPWIDEFMLFSNYPVNKITEIFSPLGNYDQAATQAYSVLFGWTAILNTFAIRNIHFAAILFFILILLSWSHRSILALFASIVAAFSLPQGFHYMSEMKHYGLEIVGTLIILAWFINKNETSRFGSKDFFLLVLGMILGFSTLPLSAIAYGIFILGRLYRKKGIVLAEMLWSGAYFSFAVLYYILVKKITVFQFSNYPGPYQHVDPIQSLSSFVYALSGVAPPGFIPLIAIMVGFLVILMNSANDPSRKRFLTITLVSLVSFALLTSTGLYPAKYLRQVLWFSAFLWVAIIQVFIILLERLHFNQLTTDNYTKLPQDYQTLQINIKYAIGTLLNLATVAIFLYIFIVNFKSKLTHAPNRDVFNAIAYIKRHPGYDLGVFGGAQTILTFYRSDSSLMNRRIFGMMNSVSTFALPAKSLTLKELDVNIREPGAFARFYQVNSNQIKALREVLSYSPVQEDFLLLSYWADFNDKHMNTLKNLKCILLEEKVFGSAKILKVRCAKGGSNSPISHFKST